MTDDRPIALTYADLRRLGVSLGKRRLSALVAQGRFPRPFKLTAGGQLHWVEAEVVEWLQVRMASRDKAGPERAREEATKAVQPSPRPRRHGDTGEASRPVLARRVLRVGRGQ
jgi:predicted DNA-binding transcriptional regulator AlpA